MLNTDFDYTYDEGPGVHNWDFWDTWVKKAIEWMMEGR
jgi:putative tributyrin esterase